jgi:hypothetical protein
MVHVTMWSCCWSAALSTLLPRDLLGCCYVSDGYVSRCSGCSQQWSMTATPFPPRTMQLLHAL